MKTAQVYDVIIVGGSYAGLSAAMSLGRSLRKVLVIDSGQPCNRQTPHSHNFLTQDGEEPSVITAKAKAQVLNYSTVTFKNGVAISGVKTEKGFAVSTPSGDEFSAAKLIFATGIKDLIPEIKGLAECWGISVIHCPYCHGYEYRQQKTAIMANGDRAFHLASLVSNLTSDLTILTSGKANFSAEQIDGLTRWHVKIREEEVTEVVHEKGYVKNIVFSDNRQLPFSAVYAAIPFVQHSGIPESLGCELTETGHLKIDNFGATAVKGIYACGDNSSMMRSVANAVASGNMVGAMVNKALVDEGHK